MQVSKRVKQSGINVGRSIRLVAKVKSDDFFGPSHLLKWERIQITNMKDCGVLVNDVLILKPLSGTLALLPLQRSHVILSHA